MVDTTDTIVAIATPPGRGGIGVVRVSGPLVKSIIMNVAGKNLMPREATFSAFIGEAGDSIDKGIAIYFPSPASYTGEDVLELHGHGGRVVLTLLVNRIIKLGARLARPGEFTERAFLNGKIDLLQAEAVADLVDSTSAHSARSALRSLEGAFSEKIHDLLNNLVAIRTLVEGSLDFSDEDIEFFDPADIILKLTESIGQLTEIINRAKQGARLREGARAVIIGEPNVGKSSLLNQLSGRDSAIVTPEPGTTRDTIAENILIEGVQLHIIDTAGLRDSNSEAETEGIRRARKAVEDTDIILFVTEAGAEHSLDENDVLPSMTSNYLILIRNKIDLIDKPPKIISNSKNRAEIFLSAKTGNGVDLLLQLLGEHLGQCDIREDAFLARERHINALEKTKAQIEKSIDLCGRKQTDLLAEELRQAQEYLGEITGAFGSDDLLGKIFSDFCIGK